MAVLKTPVGLRRAAWAWWLIGWQVSVVVAWAQDSAPSADGEEASGAGVEAPATGDAAPLRFPLVSAGGGQLWGIRGDGSVGKANRSLRSGLELTVAGEQLDVLEGEEAAHGAFRVRARAGEVEVRRRIDVKPASGALYVLDSFSLVGREDGEGAADGEPVDAIAEIRYTSRFEPGMQHLWTDSGSTVADGGQAFGGEEFGLIAVMQPEAGQAHVLMLLGGAGAPARPVVSAGADGAGSRTVEAVYELRLPADGSAVSLFLALDQIPDLGASDGGHLFRPHYWRGHVLGAGLSPEEAAAVMNFPAGALDDDGFSAPSAGALVALADLADRAGVERFDQDVLWVSKESQLLGRVEGGEVRVTGSGWEVGLPLADVAALQGGAGRGREHRVYLRDGTVLAGQVGVEGMAMQGGQGWSVEIDPEQLDVLFMRLSRRDGVPPGGVTTVVTLRSGEVWPVRIDPAENLPFVTPWGQIEVPLRDVVLLQGVREPSPRQRLVLADGSRMTGFVGSKTVDVDAPRRGRQVLELASLESLWTAGTQPPPAGEELADATSFEEVDPPVPESGSFVLLRGGNLLAGTVANPALHFLTGSTVTALAPGELARVVREDDDIDSLSPRFAAVLGGGGAVAGSLRDDVIAVQTQGQVWQVPVQHLLAFRNGGGAGGGATTSDGGEAP